MFQFPQKTETCVIFKGKKSKVKVLKENSKLEIEEALTTRIIKKKKKTEKAATSIVE